MLAQEPRLFITNDGPAAARNIRVTLDNEPIDKHPYIHEGQELIALLGPGAHSEFIVKTWDSMPTHFHCHVTWETPVATLDCGSQSFVF